MGAGRQRGGWAAGRQLLRFRTPFPCTGTAAASILAFPLQFALSMQSWSKVPLPRLFKLG